MSDLFGGKTKTTSNQTVDTGPSKFQQPFLNTAFNAAQANYNSSAGTPYYQGETYAGMSPEQTAALDNLKTYASGTGMGTAGAMSSLGSTWAGEGAKAGTTLDQFTTLANGNATADNLAAAEQYANNPNIQGLIDASTRDVSRELNEQTLPGIDRQASAGGNINSSRAGIAAGIAQRGAGDRIADISSQIRSDAYNRGLTMAQADREAKLQALGQASSEYGALGEAGVNAMSAGNNAAFNSLNEQQAAGAAQQADRQGQDTANFTKWQGQDTRATDLLNRYYGIVGSNAWGQNGTTTGTNVSKQSGNIFGQLVGAGATAASFF